MRSSGCCGTEESACVGVVGEVEEQGEEDEDKNNEEDGIFVHDRYSFKSILLASGFGGVLFRLQPLNRRAKALPQFVKVG